MYFLTRNLPSNLKLIVTTRFFIFIYYFGIFLYKCSFSNLIFFNKTLYFLNLNKKSYYSFKNLILRCFCYNKYGNYLTLMLVGIGFKVFLENNMLIFRVGYCNSISICIPFNIYIKCISKTNLILFSFDYCLLTQFCDYIYKIRKNNIYKNYGIYYKNEIVVLKKIKAKKETV